ncbi:reverse transcriptase domain-containing protein [Tanacetum coccineum]
MTEVGKFKPPPPRVTPVEKRSSNKFCDFHNDKGHSTDECMQLKKQIKELVRAVKLSHLIKEIKHGRDQPKAGKKEVPTKDKSMAIYMIQPWHRVTRQKVTQSFERVSKITFPSLTTSSGTEGPLVIEAEIGRNMIHRMYVDGGSSTESSTSGRPRSVVAKAMRLGYYWPTMHRDARDMIRTCNDCQIHRPKGQTGAWGEGIKARLGEGNKNWIEELPHVLWAHRTMIKSSHCDTPFSLTYGTEAVIPAEIRMPTYRTAVVDVVHNNEELRLNLDLLEERRKRASIREAKAK